MNKNRVWLSAAALAASTLPAMASVSETAPPAARPDRHIVAGATGLTAADLSVGPDGTLGSM